MPVKGLGISLLHAIAIDGSIRNWSSELLQE